MKFTIQYKDCGLGRKEILDRLKKATGNGKMIFADYKISDFPIKIEDFFIKWDRFNADFSIKALGIETEGQLTIKSQEIEVEAKLPFWAFALQPLIEKELRKIFYELIRRSP